MSAKLSYHGLDETTVNLFLSYLTGSKQKVVLKDCISEIVVVISAVPQGSIIEPLLLMVYTVNIFEAVKFSKVQVVDPSLIDY